MHIEFIHALMNIFIWDISIVKEKTTLFCGFERKPVHCNCLVGFFYKDLHSDMVKHTNLFNFVVFYICIHVESVYFVTLICSNLSVRQNSCLVLSLERMKL